MRKTLRGRLSYANVISTLCLFLLIGGGTALAAGQLAKNSVGTKQLKNGAVTPPKLSASAKATLTGAQGAAGKEGPPGPKGGNATATGLPTTLSSGAGESGLFTAQASWPTPASAGSIATFAVISFPIPLASAPTPTYVEIGETTPSCAGTPDAPTATAGHLCLYEGDSPGTAFNSFDDGVHDVAGASRFGTAALFVNDGLGNVAQAYGSWAVTAP